MKYVCTIEEFLKNYYSEVCPRGVTELDFADEFALEYIRWDELRKYCEKYCTGNPDLCALLADMYMNGKGAETDEETALKLLRAGVTAMCFHTRLDVVQGGVNDTLADLLGLENTARFGNPGEEVGRVGDLQRETTLADFCALVRRVTGAEAVHAADAGRPVRRVAVLGGSGSDDVFAAIAVGADTFLSGEFKHSYLTEAPECGINLIAAGHFYTENPVCQTLADWISEAFPTLTVDLTDSNPVHVL